MNSIKYLLSISIKYPEKATTKKENGEHAMLTQTDFKFCHFILIFMY